MNMIKSCDRIKKKSAHRKVLAFGTFDILHPGHISYLNQCKRHGDKLIVVIARDETVRRLKNKEPFFNEKSRRAMIASLKCVDSAILGDHINHCAVIKKVRPDSICLGYDQAMSVQHLGRQLNVMGIERPRIIRMKQWQAKIFKSSIIKKRLCALQ